MTNKEALITVSKSCKALAMEIGFGKICDTDKIALNTLKQLVDKHEELEEENFGLRNKLNTKEECCAMLEKKVKKLKNIIAFLKESFNIKFQKRLNGTNILYIYYAGITIEKHLTDKEYDLVEEELLKK